MPITHQVVGDDLDLVQQVRRQQDGAALVGVRPEQVAHPADAGRVEPVGRLVEDEHLGLADQCGRDAEPLAHAERVVAHPAAGLVVGQADPVEHLLDPVLGQAHGALRDGEDLPSGATGVLRRGVQQHADLVAGVGQVANRRPEMVPSPDVGGVSPTMTRMVVDLPAPLGPRKPVTRPGRAVNVTSSTAVNLP